MTDSGALVRPRGFAHGPAVWGWGLFIGLIVWTIGFYLLPWWAALLIWWWPSLLAGAAAGLSAIILASRLEASRRPGRGSPADAPAPPADETG